MQVTEREGERENGSLYKEIGASGMEGLEAQAPSE